MTYLLTNQKIILWEARQVCGCNEKCKLWWYETRWRAFQIIRIHLVSKLYWKTEKWKNENIFTFVFDLQKCSEMTFLKCSIALCKRNHAYKTYTNPLLFVSPWMEQGDGIFFIVHSRVRLSPVDTAAIIGPRWRYTNSKSHFSLG
jgi:hypothetical protein